MEQHFFLRGGMLLKNTLAFENINVEWNNIFIGDKRMSKVLNNVCNGTLNERSISKVIYYWFDHYSHVIEE